MKVICFGNRWNSSDDCQIGSSNELFIANFFIGSKVVLFEIGENEFVDFTSCGTWVELCELRYFLP